MKSRRSGLPAWALLVIVFGIGLLLGVLLFGGDGNGDSVVAENDGSAAEESQSIWTCSMHPQIKLHEPGKCPICFMDLIPLETDSGGEGPTELTMSDQAMRLAEIATTVATREFVDADVRTVGRVAVDERRLRTITAWMGGRLDRLYVDYTGVPVKKGEHLVEIYSPELYSAQVELIGAVEARERLQKSTMSSMKESAEATVLAAREKLRLLGITEAQVRDIEMRKKPSDHVTIYAPSGGIVIHKAAVEGSYVKTGTPIYTIADLSKVWVMLDVYESDLVWVRYAQDVAFEVEAFPGETFHGRIAFIDPTVDPKTRTVKVRVNAENPGLRLKPDMFVRARVSATIAGDGRTYAPEMAGKWISPMHPEIIKDRPGSCDICGMPLVKAEDLGFVTAKEEADPPLVVPASAPLITGRRAVVYVKIPGAERPTFEGREITLGPRAGDYYAVLAGLAEGEEVVTKGNFKIDSAMQIQAKRSMMSPEGGAPPPQGHQHGGGSGAANMSAGESAAGVDERALEDALKHGGVVDLLAPAYTAYFDAQAALASDDAASAQAALGSLVTALHDIHAQSSIGAQGWTEWLQSATEAAARGKDARELSGIRSAFGPLSESFMILEKAVGPPPGSEHHLLFCPMAFDNRGGYWLQEQKETRNPYFGESMLKCGALRESFGPQERE